ncbi:hypothetical protein VTK56DRAFT_3996 [Thermocarpiscus australiensis]
MPTRPSTSSGPGSSKSAGARPNFDKRLSKDDMALTGRMGKGRGKGLQPYIIGVKGPGPLAREASLSRKQMQSPSSVLPVPARELTPESLAPGEIQIGMALGSHRQTSSPYAASPYVGSPYAGFQPQTQTVIQSGYSSSPLQQTQEPAIQRTKTQKRRLFGSLFGGRKHAEPVKTVEAVETNRSTVSVKSSGANEDVVPARSHTVAGRKTAKHKPILTRSKTDLGFEATVQELGAPPRADGWPIITEPKPPSITSGPGLLNVEIPDIRLERYSVMFSGVLNQGGTKSSLLERRQATLEKLKTTSDRMDEEERKGRPRYRRATSPQPTKSPAFALFPQTPNRQSGMMEAARSSSASLLRPQGLTRSNTSPAHLPSPVRPSFEREPQQASPEHSVRREKKTVTILSPRTMDERNRAAQVEKLREQQQQQAQQAQPSRSRQQATATADRAAASQFGPEESALGLNSPQSIPSSSEGKNDDEEPPEGRHLPTRVLAPPQKPSPPEPQRQMTSPPSSTSSSSSASPSSADSATTKRSAASSASTRPSSSLDDNDMPSASIAVDEDDAALKAAVEISIARQISVSRQQRKLLRPLGQRGGTTTTTTTVSSAGAGHPPPPAAAAAAGGGGGRARSATVGGKGTGGSGGNSSSSSRQGQLAQAQQVAVVGGAKGRVVVETTRRLAPGPAVVRVVSGSGDRRSERVVLDVVEG